MDLKNLWGGQKIPPDVKMCYGDAIKRAKMLKSGWLAVMLKNGMVCFFRSFEDLFLIGAVKCLKEAEDGKFMVVKKDKTKAVFAPSGKTVAPFAKETWLYKNGWYKTKENGAISLYDALGNCKGSGLLSAVVAKDGSYAMAVEPHGNALFAGVFAPSGKRLLFTNDRHVRFLRNGWFIADNSLYDNLGEEYWQSAEARRKNFFSACFLQFAGSIMPRRKL